MAVTPIEISSQLLRRLHRIHQQRSDLQSQVRRGPMQIKAVQASVDASAAEVAAAAALLRKTRMVSDEKHLQLLTREAHVRDLERRLNAAATNKEFTLLNEQIAADVQANSVQNDEIYEILERIDMLEGQLTAVKQKHAQTESDATKRISEIEERQKRVVIDLDRIEVQLEETESTIPVTVKADYKRLLEARGDEALAPIENESCGGCHQTLTTQVLSRIMLSMLTYCPNCNAMLYMPES